MKVQCATVFVVITRFTRNIKLPRYYEQTYVFTDRKNSLEVAAFLFQHVVAPLNEVRVSIKRGTMPFCCMHPNNIKT